MPVVKFCVVCNKEFSVPPVRKDTALFCGKTCKAKFASDKYKLSMAKCNCKQCGKEFFIPQSRASYGGGKFCSNKCRNASMVGVSFTKKATDGSTTMHSDGYVLVRASSHPFNVAGYVFKHRLVIESEMRIKAPEHSFLVEIDSVKYLRRGIEVHHINEVKTDNRIENLIACTAAGHRDLHAGKVTMISDCYPIQSETIADEDRYKTIECKKCGNEFKVKISVWKKRGAKFCSNLCASGYEGNLPSIVYKQCETCGKEYSLRRYIFLQGTSKYCSKSCKDKNHLKGK